MPRIGLLSLTLLVSSWGVYLIDPLQAATLTVIPQPAQIDLNQTAHVSISISGLGGAYGQALGAFDFVLTFDQTAFQLSNGSFGDPTLGDQLDLDHLGSVTSIDNRSDGVRFFELSLDDASTLSQRQASSFTLVTFDLRAMMAGQYPLALTSLTLADAVGNPISANTVSANISIGTPSVPEPHNIYLILIGCLMLLGVPFRKSILEFLFKVYK